MLKKILAAAAAGAFLLTMSGCSELEKLKERFSGSEPAEATEPVSFATFEVPDAPTESPSPVNLAAVENFAAVWNMTIEGAEDMQLVPADAVASPGDGMLLGGQIFEYTFRAGRLYLYLLEGQLVGARMATNTNSWPDAEARKEWSVLWKTMIRSVNGNWLDSHYIDVINQISAGFPPPGREEESLESETMTDNGWVYWMIDYDLGYEFEKDVSAWQASFAGAHA